MVQDHQEKSNLLQTLQRRAASSCNDFPLHSRVHRLRSFSQEVWLKRDDELSCAVGGSKWRKYASLLPALRQSGADEILFLGSAASNNIIAAMQLGREWQLPCHFVLKADHSPKFQAGNRAFVDLLQGDWPITWLPPHDWSQHMKWAEGYCQQYPDRNIVVIPEGAATPAAIPGCATLALDILQQELSQGWEWDHVFVDAGSGATAKVLMAMLQRLSPQKQLHIVLIGEQDKARLFGDAAVWQAHVDDFFGWSAPLNATLTCHYYAPATARAFGALNRAVSDEVVRMAREDGVLIDPLYMAKLTITARHIIQKFAPPDRTLLIHSGGVLSLTGFWQQLRRIL